MTNFSLDIAKELFDSVDQFPVDFDSAWQWLEYSTKGNGKKSFEKAGFIEGVDFCSFIQNDKRDVGATQREVIQLTIDCFKMWAMMSGTNKGKQVRLYFLECEKIAKQVTKTQVEQRQLPPIRDGIDYVNATKDIVSMKAYLPAALTQLLLDKIGDDLCSQGQKQIEAGRPRLIGCAQKAEEMGLPVTEKNRGNLGRFVKAAGLTPCPQEERLCNGQLRKVNMYEDSKELEEAIQTYFAK